MSEHSCLTQLSAKSVQKLTEMLTSNITSDLQLRSEDPHDHTTRETIRRENLAVATSELYRPLGYTSRGISSAFHDR